MSMDKCTNKNNRWRLCVFGICPEFKDIEEWYKKKNDCKDRRDLYDK